MISCMEQPWAAIRRSKVTGEEFIDMLSVDMDQAVVLNKVKEQEREYKIWGSNNPVIRISKCVLVETLGRVK